MMRKDVCGKETCGTIFDIPDKKRQGIVLYSADAVTLGEVRVLTYSNTSNKEYVATTPTAAITSRGIKTVVALETASSAGLGKWQFSGLAEATVATGAAAGDYLELIKDGDEFVVDGTSGSTSQTDQSAAIAVDANASGENATGTVLLIDDLHEIAAS